MVDVMVLVLAVLLYTAAAVGCLILGPVWVGVGMLAVGVAVAGIGAVV